MTAPLLVAAVLLGQSAFVHIEAPASVQLMRVTSYNDDFPAVGVHAERVCTSPCDTDVELGAPFFVEAKGVQRSRELTLEGPRTTLRVQPGSAALYRAGLVSVGVAVALALLGGIALAYGAALPNRSIAYAGVGGAAAGVGAAIVGLLLVASNRTRVTVDGTGR